MTTSILNDILLIKREPLSRMFEYFATINFRVFDPIFQHPTRTEEEKKQILLFIICAFSEDSPMVILRQNSVEEKNSICEFLQIPEYMRGALVNLQDQQIRKCATEYMWQLAGELFRNLMFMRIQHEDFERDITNREFAIKEGEQPYHYDTKEHGKAIAEKERLAKAITRTELELKAQVKEFAGIESMKEWKEKGKTSKKMLTREMNIESSPQIK